MARRKSLNEAASMKHYRNWSTAKDVAKDSAQDLGLVVKQAIEELEVGKWAFKSASELKRMDANKAASRLRDLKLLCQEYGLTDVNFNPLQMDIEDAIELHDSVV